MDISELKEYQHVQQIAKDTMGYLSAYISEGRTETDISKAAESFMRSKGVFSFWYHDIGALVLVGDRTSLSVSGREYRPTHAKVKENDLVTVDLSPEISSYWGDCARSFVVESGRVIQEPSHGSSERTLELFEGIGTERLLHERLIESASPDMAFEELHSVMNGIITELGYTNLDFKSNLGHSIEKDMDKRVYIEEGCKEKLSHVKLFTFEPHIKKDSGSYGYKHEDIYYFSGESLLKL